ncbi:hypothetical protein [Bradyrhizobium zhanjiangense]|uniref:Uncharacterized protein n=1 Tax=Bradyrhizobium zhanjiangense TaxID=1325107 RepID=A0ABY0DG08_9BRAD|nr:hypothetical protein [Bradyrhizobium zhanjiangense]RXG91615.1 hypothetical protein EAS62_24355 [Bradyrhizobium zhanjiangense]
MAGFGSWFRKPAPEESSQTIVKAQIPQAETAVRDFIVGFKDRTNLHYVLIFPVVHRVAVKLFVEDFGVEVALRQYQTLVSSLTSDGTIREDQFRNFTWPEVAPDDAPRTKELDELLWRLVRELVGQGLLKEAIANALLNTAIQASAKMDGLISAGFILTVLKELRDGVHTPPPEVRPEAARGTDEVTALIFNHMRDMAYLLKDRLGLEWQHLLPGMQSTSVICCIKYRGRDGALALFQDQVQKLAPILDQCPRNPPQQLPLTKLHLTNISTFNDAFRKLADDSLKNSDIHPLRVAHALSMLTMELASKHYDMNYLSSIVSSCCTDIEQGKYNFVAKTH